MSVWWLVGQLVGLLAYSVNLFVVYGGAVTFQALLEALVRHLIRLQKYSHIALKFISCVYLSIVKQGSFWVAKILLQNKYSKFICYIERYKCYIFEIFCTYQLFSTRVKSMTREWGNVASSHRSVPHLKTLLECEYWVRMWVREWVRL